MRVIGITGGVGSGKTRVLEYLKTKYHCRILLADEAARRLQGPGGVRHGQSAALLGGRVLAPDGRIRRDVMAELIFGDADKLAAVNAIVHPAVRACILQEIEKERRKGNVDFFFLEAALLIENGYDTVVEELWYVRADEALRRERLKASRGYSDAKIDGILAAQLSDAAYRAHCSFVIDNSGELADTCEQIDRKMGEYLWKK